MTSTPEITTSGHSEWSEESLRSTKPAFSTGRVSAGLPCGQAFGREGACEGPGRIGVRFCGLAEPVYMGRRCAARAKNAPKTPFSARARAGPRRSASDSTRIFQTRRNERRFFERRFPLTAADRRQKLRRPGRGLFCRTKPISETARSSARGTTHGLGSGYKGASGERPAPPIGFVRETKPISAASPPNGDSLPGEDLFRAEILRSGSPGQDLFRAESRGQGKLCFA